MVRDHPWTEVTGSTEFVLRQAEIHVWFANLDEVAARESWDWLDRRERRRAEAFRFARHQRDFVASHVVLRAILAGYLGCLPREVAFRRDDRGKPALTPGAGLRFSVSRSSGIGAYAVVRDRPIGIDIERERPGLPVAQLVDQFFAPAERAEFSAVRDETKVAAFFRGWTRKEAYAKARGDGLRRPLDRFRVSLAADAARLLHDETDPDAPSQWSLYGFIPAPGYAGAIAVRGPRLGVTWRRWPIAVGRRVRRRSPTARALDVVPAVSPGTPGALLGPDRLS